VKVREATSNDPWGPSSSLMGEIADATYNVAARKVWSQHLLLTKIILLKETDILGIW